MKTLLFVLGLVLSVFATGCSTVDSRAKKHEAAFNSWSPEVQEKVKAGQVDVGFTPEMVQVALGDPERTVTRTTANGEALVWIYADKSPKFSIGLGVGSMRGSTGVGGGVTLGDSGWRDQEAMRVIFESGRVSAIERRK